MPIIEQKLFNFTMSSLVHINKRLSNFTQLFLTTYYRYMFKLDPDVMVKYPFHKDEWNKISYDDYSGQYPDHPPNSWFVVFR